MITAGIWDLQERRMQGTPLAETPWSSHSRLDASPGRALPLVVVVMSCESMIALQTLYSYFFQTI